MKIKVYGRLADLCGMNTIEVDTQKTVFQLKEQVEIMFPILKNQKYMVAVDKKISLQNESISSGSEIALLPPYSGG